MGTAYSDGRGHGQWWQQSKQAQSIFGSMASPCFLLHYATYMLHYAKNYVLTRNEITKNMLDYGLSWERIATRRRALGKNNIRGE